MSAEIKERFEHTLRRMYGSASKGSGLRNADLDELTVLYEYCQHLLPDSFNSVFRKIPYGNAATSSEGWLARLVRILDVEATIPAEVKAGRQALADQNNLPGLTPVFELSKDDVRRIATLCEKMRAIVFSTQEFDEPHRVRLLNRIAAIEAEIHKPKGKFDVILGGVSDIGETLGKFGKDIKPLTNRMKEIASIARKNTKEYDQLPEPEEVKRLPAPEEDNSDQ